MQKRKGVNGISSGALVMLSIMSAMTLQACSLTRTIVTAKNPLCETDMAIDFSASMDTPETIADIRRHNAAFASVCKE